MSEREDAAGGGAVAGGALARSAGCSASSTRPQTAMAAAELSRSSPLPSPKTRSQ